MARPSSAALPAAAASAPRVRAHSALRVPTSGTGQRSRTSDRATGSSRPGSAAVTTNGPCQPSMARATMRPSEAASSPSSSSASAIDGHGVAQAALATQPEERGLQLGGAARQPPQLERHHGAAEARRHLGHRGGAAAAQRPLEDDEGRGLGDQELRQLLEGLALAQIELEGGRDLDHAAGAGHGHVGLIEPRQPGDGAGRRHDGARRRGVVGVAATGPGEDAVGEQRVGRHQPAQQQAGVVAVEVGDERVGRQRQAAAGVAATEHAGVRLHPRIGGHRDRGPQQLELVVDQAEALGQRGGAPGRPVVGQRGVESDQLAAEALPHRHIGALGEALDRQHGA